MHLSSASASGLMFSFPPDMRMRAWPQHVLDCALLFLFIAEQDEVYS